MKKLLLLIIPFILVVGCKGNKNVISEGHKILNNNKSEDTIVYHKNFPSEYVDSRNVEVWLPDGYPVKGTEYQVLYVHDGQNVFNAKTSYGNISWEIDLTMDSLVSNQIIKPTIVVAIWNNGKKRIAEYMPNAPKNLYKEPETAKMLKEKYYTNELLSDKYLKFLVSELKPFIDTNYQVSTKRAATFILGSSMGGLISLYAISKYPKVFGGAAAISTHWPVPVLGEAYIEQLHDQLPNPKNHKIYFDYGTETLDAQYEPYQMKVDGIMEKKGYEKGKNWMTLKFEGAAHNETSWKKRVHIPLEFLLN